MNFAGDVVEQLPASGIARWSSSRATARGASGASPRSRERSARLAGTLDALGRRAAATW